MIPATSLEVGLLILAVEFALIACGVTFAVLHRSRSTQQHQVTEITGLVNKVAATTDVRREALSAIFAETYRFDPAETEHVVSDFIERERAFYNAMIGVHLGRGGKTLEDVPTELTKVIAPWLRLTPRNMVSVETVEALETANSVLNQALTNTKSVLDALMEEYNAAFHKDQQGQRAAAIAPPPEVDTDDLLSIDDGDLSQAVVAAAAPAGSPLRADDMFEPEGEIIALDFDTEDSDLAADPTHGLTPNDLDALMENLDTEYAREAAAA